MTTRPTAAVPTIRLAALDMAGTTIDEGGAVYAALRAAVDTRLEHPVTDEQLADWIGTSKREAIIGLLRVGGDPARERTVDSVYADFAQRLEVAYRATPPRPLPGIPEALAAMRAAGVKVVLQTGYSRPVAEALLVTVGWMVGRDIDGLVTSDEVRASRPAPYLVHHAMELADVRRVDEVLVAGDTPNDLGAGMSAGAAMVVGVLSGSGSEGVLRDHPHTHIVDSVASIPDLLGL